MEEKLIEVENLTKEYTDATGFLVRLLEDMSFDINAGNIYSFLAPTGAGKSSLLKIIAGLEDTTEGFISPEEGSANVIIPGKPSSLPWLNVKENIVKFAKNFSDVEIKKLISDTGLSGYENHFPHNKSLGFRYRIALARAIAHRPATILIDEPFLHMDEETRLESYLITLKLKQDYNLTLILGTTNITEAIFLSDFVFLMSKNPGKIIDCIEINLPGSRNTDILFSKEFLAVRNDVEQKIKSNGSQNLFKFSI